MKSVFTSLLFLTLLSITIAQPVITRNDLMFPGDEYFTNDREVKMDPGPAGANVVWDFSSATPNKETYKTDVVAAETTPFAAEFPSANLAFFVEAGGFSAYQYVQLNSNTWEEHGLILDGLGAITFSNPRSRLTFPLTYNAQWEDDFAYVEEFVGTSIEAQGEGFAESVVDGYGTLILPHVTFDNALRIKVIEEVTDSINYGVETERSIHYDTSYIWLSPSYHAPLCYYSSGLEEHTAFFITPDTIISDTEFLTSSSFQYDPMSGNTALHDVQPGKFDLSISPNPFIQNLSLAFHMEQPEDLQFILQDLRGNLIYQEAVSAQTGANAVAITLPDVPAGAYLAILRTSEGGDIQKLVKVGTK